MTRTIATLLCVAVLASFAFSGQAYAADEDTQASVYLVFDPETGEFTTVHDPNLTAQHTADAEAIASVADPAGSANAASVGGGDAGGAPLTWIIGAAIAAVLLGGFFWMRRSQQSAS